MAPELLTIPGVGVTVTAYGAAVALALVSAWALSLALARRDRLPTESVGLVFVVGALIGLVAARAGYLVQASLPLDATSMRALPAGGLAVFPGLVVAALVMAIACRRYRVPALAWLDCAAPAIALGGAFERVGAFIAGADFGRYVGPGEFGHGLSVTYPPGSPAYILHVSTLHGLPGVSESSSAPVHPVQIYLALTCALAAGIGLWLRGRRRFSGQVMLAVAAVFLLGRAVLFEPLRHGASPPALGFLRLQQLSGLGLLAAIGLAWRLLAQRAAARPEAARQWEGGSWTPRA